MNLFYQNSLSESSRSIVFNKDESRHIAKVLRHKIGDTLYITNGNGLLFTAKLIEANPKQVIAHIEKFEKEAPLPYNLHMAVAPTKNNDRFEWFLEKATEIGVSEITPIICDHSERKIIKPERFEKIIESAAKQSLKLYKPRLNPLITLPEFLESQKAKESVKMIAHCEETEKSPIKSLIKNKESFIILIGPEGDFSKNEIKKSSEYNYTPITLGKSRLRTETAAIVACHTFSMLLNL